MSIFHNFEKLHSLTIFPEDTFYDHSSISRDNNGAKNQHKLCLLPIISF